MKDIYLEKSVGWAFPRFFLEASFDRRFRVYRRKYSNAETVALGQVAK